jgi:hypothetical protein
VVLAIVGTACATSAGGGATGDGDGDGGGDGATASVSSAIGSCDAFMCGTNSPQIAEFGFWDLNLPLTLGTLGKPNNVGMQVVFFVQGAKAYLPRVIGGRLRPIDPTTNTVLAGGALVDGWLYLRNGNRQFKLRIAEVSTVDSWASRLDGKHVVLETYKLDWTELINGNWGDFRNMCKNPPPRESGDLLTMSGQNIYRTLVFEGDRIDAGHKWVTGVDTTWFNLGCAGSALAKLALTGHTEAAHVAHQFDTTLAERQTMLKLLTADYCGGGVPFTVGGQPLNWRDDHGTMKLLALQMTPPQPVTREARWTQFGAACLDKPRIDAHWTAAGAAEFGSDVYDQVMDLCSIPQCSGNTLDTDGYHLLSATP